MKNNGFALLEIVLAMSISVVVLSVGILSITSLERLKLYYSAHVLQTNLRYCQKNAMDEHRKYALTFGHDQFFYYYISRADDLGLLRKISQVVLPNNIAVKIKTNAKDNAIAYTTRGTVSTPGTITLSGNNYFVEIKVNVGSGRVKIYPLSKKKLKK